MAKRILIVDDEANILLSLEYLLKSQGFEVLSAPDGLVALDKIDDFKPDLVLLDVNMPKMSGYEVCSEIKNNKLTQHINIIMLTAKGREIDMTKGLALGADLYITKPFGTKDLVTKIKELLN